MLRIGIGFLALFAGACAYQESKTLGNYAYDGPGCDEVRATEEEAKSGGAGKRHKAVEATTLHEYVLSAVCPRIDLEYASGRSARSVVHREQRHHLVPSFPLHATHSSFDDRFPDPVKAAMFVITAASGRVNHAGHDGDVPSYDPVVASAGAPDVASSLDTATGLATMYAGWVDVNELAKSLEALAVPRGAVALFIRLYEKASAELERRVAAMPASKRAIFVAIPQRVLKSRNEYYRDHESEYAKLDALARRAASIRSGGGDVLAVARELDELRGAYVAGRGGAEGSTFEPLYLEATRELALLYVGGRMAAHAMAESALLRRERVRESLFANAIHAAQNEAAMRALEAYRTRRAAKSTGMDDALAAAASGGVAPIQFGHEVLWKSESRSPDFAAILGTAKVRRERGFVLAINKKGEKATVEFKTEYEVYQQAVNCVPTNRIESISSNGTLNYVEACQYVAKREAKPRPDPVIVDAREVQKLQAGEMLDVLVSTGDARDAVVVEARAPSEKGGVLVQVRSERIVGSHDERSAKSRQ